MLSATTTLTEVDLPHAAGHVRAALVRAGFEDVFLTKSGDSLRARGIRGRSPLATFASFTPLALVGFFSRCAVEVRCMHSLNEGDESLRLTVRVRALREFDDYAEEDWITRGPGEMLGDALQTRRVLRRVMESLTQPTDAEPEGFGTASQKEVDPAARRERFQERYRKTKARRRIQVVSTFLVILGVAALRIWLEDR